MSRALVANVWFREFNDSLLYICTENDPVEDDPFNFIFREHEGHLHYADAALPALTDKSFLSGSSQPTLD